MGCCVGRALRAMGRQWVYRLCRRWASVGVMDRPVGRSLPSGRRRSSGEVIDREYLV
jgi:hypothetical protein